MIELYLLKFQLIKMFPFIPQKRKNYPGGGGGVITPRLNTAIESRTTCVASGSRCILDKAVAPPEILLIPQSIDVIILGLICSEQITSEMNYMHYANNDSGCCHVLKALPQSTP